MCPQTVPDAMEYPKPSAAWGDAATIWEHWDGIMENGDFWDPAMNSFNHYAYGSVADWVYTVAAGIQTVQEAPGYAKARIAPYLTAVHGHIRSHREKAGRFWRYEITTPVEAEIVIAGRYEQVRPGTYYFYSPIKH